MKRLLSVLILSFIFLQTLVPFASAQTITSTVATTSAPLSTRLEEDVPRTYSTHTQMLILEVLAAASCQLAGVDSINPNGKCLGINPLTQKIGFVENSGGAISVVTNLMIFTFDIPVSSPGYINYAFSDFGIVKSSFAQTTGFSSLSPLLPVWVAFRNVVYVIFVIAFMAVGIGIMFRRNIDSKTVMSVQNAIPKIIIVLLLVTFSFAIGGLLVDFMYLTMYVMYGIVSSIDGINIPGLNPIGIVGSTPFGAIGGMGGIKDIAYSSSRGFGSQISALMEGTIIADIMGIITLTLSGPVGWLSTGLNVIGFGTPNTFNAGNEALGVIGGSIAFLIIAIALFAALVRLWITLLKAYLFILVDIAIAPLWIAASLIPGSSMSVGSWFRHIMKNIAVFPITFFIFLLGSVMVQVFEGVATDAAVFVPPFIGNSLNPKHLGGLIGLAIILLAPEVGNMAQSMFKAPDGKMLSAIPPALAVGTGMVGGPFKGAYKAGRAVGKSEIGSRISDHGTKLATLPTATRWTKTRGGLYKNLGEYIQRKKKSGK